MKTKLQTTLAGIAPSIHIETIWTPDPDAKSVLRDLRENGYETAGLAVWNSEIRVTVVDAAELKTESAYLGGTCEWRGRVPSKSNPDISGYERQMTGEALNTLHARIVNTRLRVQIRKALVHLSLL